jgi:hypothetical protein
MLSLIATSEVLGWSTFQVPDLSATNLTQWFKALSLPIGI